MPNIIFLDYVIAHLTYLSYIVIYYFPIPLRVDCAFYNHHVNFVNFRPHFSKKLFMMEASFFFVSYYVEIHHFPHTKPVAKVELYASATFLTPQSPIYEYIMIDIVREYCIIKIYLVLHYFSGFYNEVKFCVL